MPHAFQNFLVFTLLKLSAISAFYGNTDRIAHCQNASQKLRRETGRENLEVGGRD